MLAKLHQDKERSWNQLIRDLKKDQFKDTLITEVINRENINLLEKNITKEKVNHIMKSNTHQEEKEGNNMKNHIHQEKINMRGNIEGNRGNKCQKEVDMNHIQVVDINIILTIKINHNVNKDNPNM